MFTVRLGEFRILKNQFLPLVFKIWILSKKTSGVFGSLSLYLIYCSLGHRKLAKAEYQHFFGF